MWKNSIQFYPPDKSAVLTLPSLIVSNVALAILFARWSRLKFVRSQI